MSNTYKVIMRTSVNFNLFGNEYVSGHKREKTVNFIVRMRVYRTRWRGLVCFDSSRFLARVMSQKRLHINILYIDVYNFRWYSN